MTKEPTVQHDETFNNHHIIIRQDEPIQKDTSKKNYIPPIDCLQDKNNDSLVCGCSASGISIPANNRNGLEDRNMVQLQLWVYETTDLTFAEKMERKNWEQNFTRT